MTGKGLTKTDLEQIRGVLDGGKRPRVMFTESAGQIAGQIGQVVALEDPDAGDEWIVVKFGGDALPFSPADLQMPPKGAAARRADAVVTPAPEQTEPAGRRPLAIGEDLIEPGKNSTDKTARQEPAVSDVKPAEPAAPAPRKPAARAAKAKTPPGLVVTLAYTEGEWTVGAMQGSKALAKPYVIKPAEALKMVSLLDVPGVQEAVEQILSSERDNARAAAEKLRAELAEIEAKLAELGA
ncbi:MAG: hypothetical protein HOV71_17345 [Hamadaea sp.]|uniref:hypothetical protein n=1 Tax=Hamadaea sp. TaxID=2024425 RepID=UPI0017BC8BEA|nr:hypothetical protein [Hamadaea sp.]NUR49894.1 hypothetical protein [Hamadaea sp.]NUR73994.1 hypothetical protein [Hamadaea sp.]NUT21207.1 hypothetical protein [Hamadaea sp.]